MTIKPIITKRLDKSAVNGFLLPIWNATESDYRPQQIYITVVNPGEVKGPHRHNVREGRFVCIKGDVRFVTRTWSTYATQESGESAGHVVVCVPPGMPCAIYNVGTEPAYVLNMPSPAWTAENPDDHPVSDWEYEL